MILGIIPARGGSDITDKNIKPLCNRPLIEYTIDAVEQSNVDDWFVFTDKYTNYKTLGIKRLDKYSKGEYNSVVQWLPYAIFEYEKLGNAVDKVCLLQPTSPLRTYRDINKALELSANAHSLTSGSLIRIKTDKVDNKKNEKHFQRNGAIFIFDKSMIDKGKLWDEFTVKMVMPKSRSIDVDTKEDFMVCESLLRNGVLTWNMF